MTACQGGANPEIWWFAPCQTYAEQEAQQAGVTCQEAGMCQPNIGQVQHGAEQAVSPRGINSLTSAREVPLCARLTRGQGKEEQGTSRRARQVASSLHLTVGEDVTGRRNSEYKQCKPLLGRRATRWQFCLPAGVTRYWLEE